MPQDIGASLNALKLLVPPCAQEIVFLQTAAHTMWITPIGAECATERALDVIAAQYHTTRDQAYMWASGYPTPHMLHVRHGPLALRRWIVYSKQPLGPVPTPTGHADSLSAVRLLDALSAARDIGDTAHALTESPAPQLLREWLEAANMVR